ncbi:MAG: hypothetical protein IPO00_08890 [Betaproteobacteria bacterium]|nr:hypothetical protein [Betaproteobacteria bacterium]
MTEDAKPPEVVISQDQATVMVARHLLVVLEDVISAHEAVLNAPDATETAKANARLVVAAAGGIGRPLYMVAKAAARPRILRPERSIRIAR